MIIRDSVLTRECQLYYDYFGPHNRELYGEQTCPEAEDVTE